MVAVVLRWRRNGVLLGICHAAGPELAGTWITSQAFTGGSRVAELVLIYLCLLGMCC
jgi:hypothetical protein